MRLAPGSHDRLEHFFRQHFGDEALTLPRMEIYAGRFATRLTTALGFGALTFGRRVLLARTRVRRGDDGLLRAPGALIAHEAAHALQYAREGRVRLLLRYLFEYVRALRESGERGPARHRTAYRAISFEAEAHDAEDAYASWARESEARDAPP